MLRKVFARAIIAPRESLFVVVVGAVAANQPLHKSGTRQEIVIGCCPVTARADTRQDAEAMGRILERGRNTAIYQ